MLCDVLALQRWNRAFSCCPIAMQPSQLSAQRRSPYFSLVPIRLRERSSAHRFRSSCSLASADLIEQSVRAWPDALFDLFEFVFSPVGLAVISGFVAVAFLWSSRDSNEEDSTLESSNMRLTQNDTDKSKMMRKIPKNLDPDSIYLEMRLRMAKQTAEEEERIGTRFVIRFSGEKDAIYENPVNGGAFKLRAGVPYVQECKTLKDCWVLANELRQRLGDDKFEFQIFEVRGQNWVPRFASSWAPPRWAEQVQGKGDGLGSTRREGLVGEEEEDENSVDREWRQILEEAKLFSRPNSGLNVTIITGDNACKLCNGRGFRGCSSCSTPANVPDDMTTGVSLRGRSSGEFEAVSIPDFLGSCRKCFGRRLVACEWCQGTGLKASNA